LSYAGGAALQGVELRKILPRKLVATKNNFRSFIYGQSSTLPANLVKNGPVNVEIIGLTKISKKQKKNIKHQQNISHPRLRFAQSGWAIIFRWRSSFEAPYCYGGLA